MLILVTNEETEVYRVGNFLKVTLKENGGIDSYFRAHTHRSEAICPPILFILI